MLLVDAAIAQLGVLEDPLENAERSLHLGAYEGLVLIYALLFLVRHAIVILTLRWVISSASVMTSRIVSVCP